MENLKLKIILGSVREARFSEKILPWVKAQVEKHGGFEIDVLDLRDYQLPFYNEPTTPSSKKEPFKNETVAKWTAKIGEADAFLFIMPEYNRAVPGVLKNALDWVYPEWNQKVAGYVGYGTVGGARAIENARLIAVEQQMATVRQAVNVFAHWTLQDEQGNVRPGSFDQFEHGAQTMLDQLQWWGNALKAARAAK